MVHCLSELFCRTFLFNIIDKNQGKRDGTISLSLEQGQPSSEKIRSNLVRFHFVSFVNEIDGWRPISQYLKSLWNCGSRSRTWPADRDVIGASAFRRQKAEKVSSFATEAGDVRSSQCDVVSGRQSSLQTRRQGRRRNGLHQNECPSRLAGD
jgi:hypothetical protein